MADAETADLGPLLSGAARGETAAVAELAGVVHRELRTLASSLLRGERIDHTLQTTALVNEAWMRLLGSPAGPTWENPRTFFKGTATAMRRVLIDHARHRRRVKRGGDRRREPIEAVLPGLAGEPLVADQVLDLHEALEELATLNERAAQIVDLRIFGGLTIDQTAAVLGVSTGTVELDYKTARAWLRERLEDADGP